jgi:hypothetical protein
MHALNVATYALISLGFGFWLVELLSPAVVSYCTSLPYFMMLSLACGLVLSVGLPSVMV